MGSKENHQAAECRRQAKLCIKMAERVSMRADPERLIAMAREWLELAQRAETEPIPTP